MSKPENAKIDRNAVYLALWSSHLVTNALIGTLQNADAGEGPAENDMTNLVIGSRDMLRSVGTIIEAYHATLPQAKELIEIAKATESAISEALGAVAADRKAR